MLEKMEDFFEARLDGYEDHQLTCIEYAQVFYPFTAQCLPREPGCTILDLGCGTGLELNYYFPLAPLAKVTGIDLSSGMLQSLKAKFADNALTLHQGSYFELPLGESCFDAAVSVESLHHFTQAQKLPLYRKLHTALKENGYFILTDYFAPDDRYENFYQQELLRLKKEQGLPEGVFYHYDTPLTTVHEIEALIAAGFSQVDELGHWGHTHILKAYK